MNASQAIENLEKISQAIDNVSNRKDIYNTDYGFYLEQMSFEMQRFANDLRCVESRFGVFSDMEVA